MRGEAEGDGKKELDLIRVFVAMFFVFFVVFIETGTALMLWLRVFVLALVVGLGVDFEVVLLSSWRNVFGHVSASPRVLFVSVISTNALSFIMSLLICALRRFLCVLFRLFVVRW